MTKRSPNNVSYLLQQNGNIFEQYIFNLYDDYLLQTIGVCVLEPVSSKSTCCLSSPVEFYFPTSETGT
jgi:hypothetical protein